MVAFLLRGLAVSRHSSFVPKNTQCLRWRQKLVQEFCEGVKIPYSLYGFVQKAVGGSEKQAALLASAKEMWQREVISFKFQARYFTSSERIRAAHFPGTSCGGTREGFICEVHIDSLRHFGAPV
jgi:hypothetical protein